MNKQQLREQIKQLRSNNQSLASTLTTESLDSLLDLIDQYAYEYAERVIGDNKAVPSFGAVVADKYYEAIYGNMRAKEQRERNRELSSHGE